MTAIENRVFFIHNIIMNTKLKLSLILNISTAVIVTVALIMGLFNLQFIEDKEATGGVEIFKYFTVQSNILAGVACAVFAVYEIMILKGKADKVPTAVYVFKYIANVGVTVTMLTVACYLAPVVADSYFSLFINCNLFFHFLAPMTSLVGFLFFENTDGISFFGMVLGIVHFLVYGTVYMVVAYSNYDKWSGIGLDRAYNWYGLANQDATFTLIFSLIMTSIVFLICVLTWLVNRKLYKKVGL